MAVLVLLRGAMGAGKTTVGNLLQGLLPDAHFVEVDDIKCELQGGAGKCNPAQDFTEAGRRARMKLDGGQHVVVIEPLCERKHVNYVLRAAGVMEGSPNLVAVWLDCTKETALQRKRPAFTAAVIEQQHGRYRNRCVLPHELVISTDDVSAESVADTVYQLMLRRIRTGRS